MVFGVGSEVVRRGPLSPQTLGSTGARPCRQRQTDGEREKDEGGKRATGCDNKDDHSAVSQRWLTGVKSDELSDPAGPDVASPRSRKPLLHLCNSSNHA